MTARPPGGTSRQPGRVDVIDGLRAITFLLVFTFHAWLFSGTPDLGPLTVAIAQNTRPDFFVVLTGMVLVLPFAMTLGRAARLDARGFIVRRLRRIVLPYYVALVLPIALPALLVVAMRAAGQPASWQPLPSPGDLLAHLTFTHLLFPESWSGINGSLWTMSLETQLYVAFPLVLAALARWRWTAALGLVAVSVAYHAIGRFGLGLVDYPESFLWTAQAPGRLLEFLAGGLAAWVLWRWRPVPTRRLLVGLAAMAVVAYAVAVTNPPTGWGLREAALGGAFAAASAGAVLTRAATPVLGRGPLRWLGFRSYSMFLVHEPLVWYTTEWQRKLVGQHDPLAVFAMTMTVGLAIVMAVGTVLFRYVERPCLSWSKRMPTVRPLARGHGIRTAERGDRRA